ncbi:MAG: GNAT family N-acetyltransferase [Rhodoferax sp.]|nr:GNAT family N-acetyltransferase [Rhodoferax sp.]MCP5263502.1 GNAT family N-acetyltransferase [Rhodoferax sp.]
MAAQIPALASPSILLRPLAPDDGPALVAAASDGALWNLPFTVVPSAATVEAYLATALQGLAAGTVWPFAIVDARGGGVIGSTRFWKIDRINRKLEIGHTWLSASWQGTLANTQAKCLLLTQAFDTMACVRVQFTTDVLNERSQRAIERLGAVREGVVRHERIMPDGRKRDSVRYSIIDTEWPQVRERLLARLRATTPATDHRPG